MIGQSGVVKLVKRSFILMPITMIGMIIITLLFNIKMNLKITDFYSLLIVITIGSYFIVMSGLVLVDSYLRRQKYSQDLIRKITRNDRIMIVSFTLFHITFFYLVIFT